MADYTGIYDYKGFSIISPSEGYWIAEPNWETSAIEEFKNSKDFEEHSTIKKAKEWINKIGINLNEADYHKANNVKKKSRYNNDGTFNNKELHELEWTLRYGSESEIIENRLTLAHVLSLYLKNN